MWTVVGADVREMVAARVVWCAPARAVDTEMRRMVDEAGTRVLAGALARVTDDERAAAWMADDAGRATGRGAGGWRVAYERLREAEAGRVPTGSGIGRYLTVLASGARPTAWPDRSREHVWDLHPYDPGAAPASGPRLVVVVGDERDGVSILVRCLRRALPAGVSSWEGSDAAYRWAGRAFPHRLVIFPRTMPDDELIAGHPSDFTIVVVVRSLDDASDWVRGHATSVVRMGYWSGRLEDGRLVCGTPRPVRERYGGQVAGGLHYRPGSSRVRTVVATVGRSLRKRLAVQLEFSRIK